MAENSPTKPLLSPFELIDTAWQAYLKRVPLLTKLVLPPVLFYLVLDTLSYVADHGISGQPFVMAAQFIEHTVLITAPLAVIGVILQTFSTAALLVALKDKMLTSVSAAYQEGARKILSFWWISLLSFAIISSGFVLFFLPGLMFSVWFTFATYILFAEGKRGMSALLQSREYVRGYFWQVTGRVLFILLITAALSSLAGVIGLVVNNGVVSQIAQSFVSLITVPLALLYQYRLYENIVKNKGAVVIKTKAWWLYLIGLLIPLSLLVALGTIIYFLRFYTVPDNSMKPRYQKGERLVLGAFPGVTESTKDVIYSKDGSLLLRRVLASSDEKLMRQGNTISVLPKDGGDKSSPFFLHNGSYNFAFFVPPFLLVNGKELTVGKDDVYVVAENIPVVKQTWDKITIDHVVGVPLFCYWNCTGKE